MHLQNGNNLPCKMEKPVKLHLLSFSVQMALSPMAFAIDIEERQCQKSTGLRLAHHLQNWRKTECAVQYLT